MESEPTDREHPMTDRERAIEKIDDNNAAVVYAILSVQAELERIADSFDALQSRGWIV